MGGKGDGKGESSKSFGKGLFKRGLLSGHRKSSDGRSTGSADHVSLPESPSPLHSQQRQQLEEELLASKQAVLQLQRSYQALESEQNVLRMQLTAAEQTTESLREQLFDHKLQMQALQRSKSIEGEKASEKLQKDLESSKLKTTELLHQVQKLTEANDQMHEELNEARMQQRKLRMELLKHEAKGKGSGSSADSETQYKHIQELQSHIRDLELHNQALLKQLEDHATAAMSMMQEVQHVQALQEQVAKLGAENQQLLQQVEGARASVAKDRGVASEEVEALRLQLQAQEQAQRQAKEAEQKLQEANAALQDQQQELQKLQSKLQEAEQLKQQSQRFAEADKKLLETEAALKEKELELQSLRSKAQEAATLQQQNRQLEEANRQLQEERQRLKEQGEARDMDMEQQKAVVAKVQMELELQAEQLEKQAKQLEQQERQLEEQDRLLMDADEGVMMAEKERVQASVEIEELQNMVTQLQGKNLSLVNELQMQAAQLESEREDSREAGVLKRRLAETEQQKAELEKVQVSLESEKKELQEKLMHLEQEVEGLSKANAELSRKSEDADVNSKHVSESLARAEQDKESLMRERDVLQTEKEVLIGQVQELQRNVDNLNEQQGSVLGDKKHLLDKVQQLEQRNEILERQNAEVQELCESVEREADESSKKLQELTEKIEKLQKLQADMEEQSQEAAQKLQQLTFERDDLQQEQEVLQQEAASAHSAANSFRAQVDALQTQLAEMEGRHQQTVSSKESLAQKLQALEEEHRRLAMEQDLTRREREVQLGEKESELVQEAARLRQLNDELGAANLQLSEARQHVEEAKMQLEVEKEQLSERVVQLEQQNETLEADVNRLQEQYCALQEQFDEWDSKTRQLEERNRELQAAADAAQELMVQCRQLERQVADQHNLQQQHEQLLVHCRDLEQRLQTTSSSADHGVVTGVLRGFGEGFSGSAARTGRDVRERAGAEMGEPLRLDEVTVELAQMQALVAQLQTQNETLVQELTVQAQALEEEQKISAEAARLQQVVQDLEVQVLQLQQHSSELLAEREAAVATMQENKQRSMEVEQLNHLVHELEVQNLNLLEEVHRSGMTSPPPETQVEVEKLRDALAKVHEESEQRVAEAKAEVAWLRTQLKQLTGKGEREKTERGQESGESAAAARPATTQLGWLSARESREGSSHVSQGPDGSGDRGSLTARETGMLSTRERGLLSAILRGEVVASPSQVLLSPTRWTPSGSSTDMELKVDELMQLVKKLEQENNALSDAARRAASEQQQQSSQEMQEKIFELEEANRQLQERCMAAEQQEVERVQNAISAHFLGGAFDDEQGEPLAYGQPGSSAALEDQAMNRRDLSTPTRGRRSRSQSRERADRSRTPSRSRSIDMEAADSLVRELEELRYKYREENKSAEALRAQNARTWFELNQAVDQVKDLKEKKGKVETDLARSESEVAYLREQIQESEVQLEELLSALSSYEHSNVLVTKRHEALQNRVKRQLTELRRTSNSQIAENEQLRQECAEWRSRAEELQAAYDSLSAEADMMQQRLEEFVQEVNRGTIRGPSAELREREAGTDGLAQQVEALEEHLYGVGLRNEALQNSLNAMEEKLLLSQAECRALEDENKALTQKIAELDSSLPRHESPAKSRSTRSSSPKVGPAGADPAAAGLTATTSHVAMSSASSIDSLDKALKRGLDMWDAVPPAARASSPSAQHVQAIEAEGNVQRAAIVGPIGSLDEALIEDVAELRRKNEELQEQLRELEARARYTASAAGGAAGLTLTLPDQDPRPASPLLSPFVQHAMDALRDENEGLYHRVLSLESELRHREEDEYREAGGYEQAEVLALDEQSGGIIQAQSTVVESSHPVVAPSWSPTQNLDTLGTAGDAGQGSVHDGQGGTQSKREPQLDPVQFAALLAQQEQSPQVQQLPLVPVTSAQLFKAQSQELQARLNGLQSELVTLQLLSQQQGESAALQQRLQDILLLMDSPAPTRVRGRATSLLSQQTAATNFFSSSSTALSESQHMSGRLLDSNASHQLGAHKRQVLSPGRVPPGTSSLPSDSLPSSTALHPSSSSATATPAHHASVHSSSEQVYEPLPWQPAQVVDVTDLSDVDHPAALEAARSVMSPGRLTQFLHLVSELEDILGIVHVPAAGELEVETTATHAGQNMPSDLRLVHRLLLVADRARERMGTHGGRAASNNPFTMLAHSSQQQHDESLLDFDPFNQHDTGATNPFTSSPLPALHTVPEVKLDSHALSHQESPLSSQRFVKRRLNTPELVAESMTSSDEQLRGSFTPSSSSEHSVTMLDATVEATASADVLSLEPTRAGSPDVKSARSGLESDRQLSFRCQELQVQVEHLQAENKQLQEQCETLIQRLNEQNEDQVGRWVILKNDHEKRVESLKEELRSTREKMEGLQDKQMAHNAERQQRVMQLQMLEHQLSLEQSERSHLKNLVSQLQALGALADPESPDNSQGPQAAHLSNSSSENSPDASGVNSPVGLEQMVQQLTHRNQALERKVQDLRAAAQQLRDQVKVLESQNQRSEASLRKLLLDKNRVEQEMTAVLESIELLREEMKAIIENLKLKETQQLELCEALEAKEQEAIQLRGQVRDLSRALAAVTAAGTDSTATPLLAHGSLSS